MDLPVNVLTQVPAQKLRRNIVKARQMASNLELILEAAVREQDAEQIELTKVQIAGQKAVEAQAAAELKSRGMKLPRGGQNAR